MEKQIARIETKLEEVDRRIGELQGSLGTMQSKEMAGSVMDACEKRTKRLEERIVKIEGNLGKVTWIVIGTVISAILYTVLG